MVKKVDVLVAGGGISGLTLANLLANGSRQNKFNVTVFEPRPITGTKTAGIGGGIGLWPPSQSVLSNIPNFRDFLAKHAHLMPSPSYRDSEGHLLARASKEFGAKFPVQCLNRNDLVKWLGTNLEQRDDVHLVQSKISGYHHDGERVIVETEDGTKFEGDVLVACDGIHSNIRKGLMSELGLPPVTETDLGYTYFRANVDLPEDSEAKPWSAAFETWGSHQSPEHGNHEVRFGYVPLKEPSVFWFMAVKTQKDHPHLSPIDRVQEVDGDTKAFLSDLVKSWKPATNDADEVVVDYEQLILSTDSILRTDIAKIAGVETFPWTSRDNRIILLGDAAHATAPNIAQGAGLCIEDAATLASKLDRVDYLHGIPEYEQERKERAKTVQSMADAVASIGQVENPLLKTARNSFMRSSTYMFPSLQQSIFDRVVSHSLGGSKEASYWQPPRLSESEDDRASLFGRFFSGSDSLPEHVRTFKNSSRGGSGEGVVTVERPTIASNVIGAIAGLPKEMTEQPFRAEVTNLSGNEQRWRRTFGFGTPLQRAYATTHSTFCDFKRDTYLSEGVGGYLDKAFRFIYKVKRQDGDSIKYESEGLTFYDLFRLPLPRCLLPKSEWVETPTEKGWTFDGNISFPMVGSVLNYSGHFDIDKNETTPNRRLVIAGGSGMIGKEVCQLFIKKGYDVYCLSRSASTQMDIEGVNVRALNDDWSDLIDSNTIILNLSGSNPGSKRWTTAVKDDIAESRMATIETITSNIERAAERPLKFLQASAAGFYGDAGDKRLTEDSMPVETKDLGTQFRVDVCRDIETKAAEADCDVVNLRIGHVLSNAGGLYPYCRMAGFFNAGRFGSGKQYVPFVHISDAAKAIEFVASDDAIKTGAINITAPNPCTNADMLKELRLSNWVPGLPLPESVLKMLVGESSVILTDSERVEPKRLLESGYEFDYSTIKDCLIAL
jgi:uncharacterized protein (TIGR01777 family)